MSKKPNLPAEVHDHFRKANLLHTYVQKSLGEATKHALETGQELLAAKAAIPHGGWESECDRLFDGSARTARFYMEFAKNMGALKTAGQSAVLLLESTLEGAAKAAKRAAKPSGAKPPSESGKPETPTPEEPEVYVCPNCQGTEQDDDGDCASCREPTGGGGAGDTDGAAPGPAQGKSKPPNKPIKALTGRAREAFDARAQIKIWHDTIGRWCSQSPTIDELRGKFPGPKGDAVLAAAGVLYEALDKWGKSIK